jgi:signal transduction histidine kinase
MMNTPADRFARRAPRLAWGLACLCLALIGALILLGWLNRTPPSRFVADNAFTLVFGSVFPVIGGLVASRHPRNPTGWLMIGAPLFSILAGVSGAYADRALVTSPGSLPGGDIASWVSIWAWIPFLTMALLLLMLLPDGRPVSPRWRWLVYLALAEGAFRLAGFMALWPLRGVRLLGSVETNTAGVPLITKIAFLGFPIFAFVTIASIASVIVRFVRSRGEERLQLKWITLGVVILGVEFVISLIHSVSTVADAVAIVPLGVAIAFAILKYRLYDIDVVINKALVYGAMAGFITAVYVAIVVGIGHAVGSNRNLGLSILATALVAVAFQPIRERVRRFANRLVYGRRATPYEVLSEFSGGMAHAVATEELLPRMARIVAEGTGAARADVWLHVGPELIREATWPEGNGQVRSVVAVSGDGQAVAAPDADATIPVRHQGELLGVIGVKKSPGEAIAPAEAKLLQDLASQAGLVLRNVRLIEELKTSRQRLVTTQDEERRRLERDLHDGAQQRLVAISLALRMAKGLLNPQKDAPLGERLDRTSEELALALKELREFARGIHPAILTERGLVPALHSLAERSTVPATLEAVLDERPPPAVEATVYFVVSEALANVGKYSRATAVDIHVAVHDGELRVEIRDDGVGGADASHGSGLRGLGDRVAAVDGTLDIDSPPSEGTRLTARIPVPVLAGATP